MGLRLAAARAISGVSTAALKHVFRRPAGNFPGKVALYVDPRLIADLAPQLDAGSIVVCGTNGKTTITNLIADSLEAAGKRVVCNRTGANLDSGIATALLHGGRADWGVFESDEMWLIKSLPQLQSQYLLLLNLFRDQVDRYGEIENIQASIAEALTASPGTVLIYNADDPVCAGVAERVSNPRIPFGIEGVMEGIQKLDALCGPENSASELQMCQRCSEPLEYEYHQYDQLGAFRCTGPGCGFAREPLVYAATNVVFDADGVSFRVSQKGTEGSCDTIAAPFQGAYMVYNVLATFVATQVMGCSKEAFDKALAAFDPQNGRLQRFTIEGRSVLLNLAKNPTGFNQNISLILGDKGPKAVAIFVNDKQGDGRDVSWLEDVSFESLASTTSTVFAGGLCKNELQARLKKAGLDASLVQDANEVLDHTASLSIEHTVYFITNYTALPAVHSALQARSVS